MTRDFWEYTPLDRWSAPVDEKRCRHHVYGPGLDMRGHQCTRRPVPGTKYCRQHTQKVERHSEASS